MSAVIDTRRQFLEAKAQQAEGALLGLSDRDKVHFALALLMKTTDPDAVAALRFAGNQLAELSRILMREEFDRVPL